MVSGLCSRPVRREPTGALFGGPAGAVIGAVVGVVAGGIGGQAELVVPSIPDESVQDEYTMRTHSEAVDTERSLDVRRDEGVLESDTKQDCRESWHRLDETDKQIMADNTTELTEKDAPTDWRHSSP